jgi:hypothetical protein
MQKSIINEFKINNLMFGKRTNNEFPGWLEDAGIEN